MNAAVTMNVNTLWFRDRLADKKLSQRRLAKLLDLDPSAITLSLRGERRWTNVEVLKLAEILGVQTTEVMRQCGVPVEDDVVKYPIAAYVDTGCLITPLTSGTYDHVLGPSDIPTSSYVVQMRAVSDLFDGWLHFVDGTKNDPMDVVDHLAVCALDSGKAYLSHLRRGYKAGTFNLVLTNRELMDNQRVSWASQVFWVKPV